jgi:hypothetical protein
MQDPTEKHISDVGILDKYNYNKRLLKWSHFYCTPLLRTQQGYDRHNMMLKPCQWVE